MNTRRKFIGELLLGSLGFTAAAKSTYSHNFAKNVSKVSNIPILKEYDICVLGGSCTGVFAAIRAARLGASVCIVEKQNGFGGVATNSLVNIWHSLFDTAGKQQIIAGLTSETLGRLSKRDAVLKSDVPSSAFTFNSLELKIELDEMVIESHITPYLNTLFSEPYFDKDGILSGVIVDGKSGRFVIKAKYFIDATGDGDLAFRLGLETYTNALLQPPTTCANLENWDEGEFNKIVKQHGSEFNIPEGFVWGALIPTGDAYMLAGTRIYGYDCSVAKDLTSAEIEGRRQIRAIMDMMRKYGHQEKKINLVALPSYIGIRETRHIKCLYQVSDKDAMYGKRFDDAIANGSYRFDLHLQNKPGIIFRYLDGKEVYSRPGYSKDVVSRWRDPIDADPTFYQVPLRSLIPRKFDNLMVAGRMFDASMIAYSGIRVMVNMNQLGEAAGVTSYLALTQNKRIKDVSSKEVRNELNRGGSVII